MEKYLLGIDVGTTGTKAMLFSESGQLLNHAYQGYPMSNPKVGWSEQNAEDWWNAVKTTVNELCKDPAIGKQVAAISLSLQGGTFVPVDADGNALRSAIVWNDHRCTAEKEAFLKEVGPASEMYQLTGWNLGTGLPLLSVRWLRENEPEIFAKTALFLSVPDYVSLKMTGIAAIDPSDAGINQFSDISSGSYHPKLLAFAGIREEQLPKIVPSGTAIGHLTEQAAEELGLSTDAVLVAGAHDQYAVALGAGATEDGDILIGSGTCWVVTAISDASSFDTGLSQSVSAVPGKWGSLQSLSSGGVCLDWLRNNVGDKDKLPYDTINQEVDARKAAEEGLYFFPFSGKSGDKTRFSKASFFGLDLSHDRFHMARAVMEGVAFQTRWMMESFRAKPGEAGIILAGGASKSLVWTQITADIFGLPVRVTAAADLACVGAAVMAGVGCGMFANVQEGCKRLAMQEHTFQPDPVRAQMYEREYAAYKNIAKTLGMVGKEV